MLVGNGRAQHPTLEIMCHAALSENSCVPLQFHCVLMQLLMKQLHPKPSN